jgi:hypothetical protein
MSTLRVAVDCDRPMAARDLYGWQLPPTWWAGIAKVKGRRQADYLGDGTVGPGFYNPTGDYRLAFAAAPIDFTPN